MIYNSSIEIGLRVLVILKHNPSNSNLDVLNYLDYISIYSEDFDSNLGMLHPNLPLKIGEITSRRDKVKSGLQMLIMKGLVNKNFTSEGVEYGITESGNKFVGLLKTDYAKKLKSRARWAVKEYDGQDSITLYNEIMST